MSEAIRGFDSPGVIPVGRSDRPTMTGNGYADGGRLPSERQYRDDCPKCKTRDVPMTRHEGATVGLTCGNCGKTWAAPTLDEAQALTPDEAYEGGTGR